MPTPQMYFGTRTRMQWVRCPSVSMPSSKVGWQSKTDYLNGGAYVRRSTAAHKEYRLTWNVATRDEMRPILDYADRLYGDGPFYWIDPFVSNYNLLPQWFASPFQGLDDGIILTGETTRGSVIATPDNTLNYPTRSILYTVTDPARAVRVWVPIPPGHTAWVGAHGQDVTGGTVQVIPTTGPATTGTPSTLTLLGVTDPTRFNASFSGNDYTGIYLTLGGSGSVILSGLMVQVLRDGVTPETGGFISGQGHSGCEFVEQPTYTPYSSAFDTGGLVANFVETGGWM